MNGFDEGLDGYRWKSHAGSERSLAHRTPVFSSHCEPSTGRAQERKWINLARQLGVPYLSLTADVPSISLAWCLPADRCERWHCVPVAREGRTLTVAMLDPKGLRSIRWIAEHTGCDVYPVLSSPKEVSKAVERLAAFQGLSESTEAPGAGTNVVVAIEDVCCVSDLLAVEHFLKEQYGAVCVVLPRRDGDWLVFRVSAEAGERLLDMLRMDSFPQLVLKRMAPKTLELEFRRG